MSEKIGTEGVSFAHNEGLILCDAGCGRKKYDAQYCWYRSFTGKC